jgi:hypothetical protein
MSGRIEREELFIISRAEMKKITPILLGLLLALFWGNASPAQKIKTVDGVTVVSNGKKPVAVKGQPSMMTLVEELAVGGGGNPDEALSQVSTFVVDGEGGIFALDFKDQKIKVFDKSGKFLRQIGKPGQGPGELWMASGIQLMADGTLAVEDATNRRLAYFKPSGEFIKNISTSDKLALVNLLLDGKGNAIGREMGVTEGNAKMLFEIKKFDSNLKPLFTLDKIEFPVPIPGSGTKINVLDMISAYQFSPSGHIYYGRNADYEIKVYSPEGSSSEDPQRLRPGEGHPGGYRRDAGTHAQRSRRRQLQRDVRFSRYLSALSVLFPR